MRLHTVLQNMNARKSDTIEFLVEYFLLHKKYFLRAEK